jgi:Translation initiation factor eIF3 subunit 135
VYTQTKRAPAAAETAATAPAAPLRRLSSSSSGQPDEDDDVGGEHGAGGASPVIGRQRSMSRSSSFGGSGSALLLRASSTGSSVSGSGAALTNWETSAWDEGPSVVEVLHLHGVNLRHLGLLRAHVGQLLRDGQQQQQQQQQHPEDAPLSADAVQRIQKLRWRLLLEMLSRALKSLLRERQVYCCYIICIQRR